MIPVAAAMIATDSSNGLCQKIIRNRIFIKINKNCQAFGTIVGLVTSITGIYFARMQEQAYFELGYGIGFCGVLTSLYSCFGRKYIQDYGQIFKKLEQAQSLQDVQSNIEDHLADLAKIRDDITLEEKEIRVDLEDLVSHIDVLTEEVPRIKQEVLSVTKVYEKYSEISGEFKTHEDLLTSLADRFVIFLVKAKQIKEATDRNFHDIEERLESREAMASKALGWDISNLAKFNDQLKVLKEENFEEYQRFIDRFPFMKV